MKLFGKRKITVEFYEEDQLIGISEMKRKAIPTDFLSETLVEIDGEMRKVLQAKPEKAAQYRKQGILKIHLEPQQEKAAKEAEKTPHPTPGNETNADNSQIKEEAPRKEAKVSITPAPGAIPFESVSQAPQKPAYRLTHDWMTFELKGESPISIDLPTLKTHYFPFFIDKGEVAHSPQQSKDSFAFQLPSQIVLYGSKEKATISQLGISLSQPLLNTALEEDIDRMQKFMDEFGLSLIDHKKTAYLSAEKEGLKRFFEAYVK